MLWSILTHRAGFIGDRAVGARRAEQAKDLAIALLRHQLRLVQRRSPRSPRRSRGERLRQKWDEGRCCRVSRAA